jgi:RNA polymerase sigma factor (sigma-70 family)
MAELVITATEEDYPAGDRDAELVERILAGDREAMADLYDRYADRIHTMCVHMLHDDDEAADVTAQVFLVALQRLAQLREPRKLRPWLFAIARNEVYTRSRHRSRVRPMEGVEDMSMLSLDPTQFEAAGPDATAELPAVDNAALVSLIQAAAGGLDERDRMVLELNLTQGIEGAELADALGVKLDNAYQLTHRMKERLERSIGALLVVKAGRELCPDLDGVAKKWDGHYDVLWRKRFSRHVDNCERCQRMRSRLPKAVLAGAVLSQAAQSAVLAAPISVREQVLAQGPAVLAGEAPTAWSDSGFPATRRRPRMWQLAVGAVVAALVVLGVGGSLDEGWREVEVTTTTSSTTASTTTTAVPTTTVPTTQPPRTTTTVRRTTTTVRPTTTTTAAPSTTTTTTTTSSTTTTTITRATTTTTVKGYEPPIG